MFSTKGSLRSHWCKWLDCYASMAEYLSDITEIFAVAFPLVSSPFVALALLTLVLFFGTVPFGAGVASFPLITPNRMRAQIIAMYLLVANLFGYSAGPLLVAWLTDNVFGSPSDIDRSLAIAPPATMAIGLILVALAMKPYRKMILRIEAEQ